MANEATSTVSVPVHARAHSESGVPTVEARMTEDGTKLIFVVDVSDPNGKLSSSGKTTVIATGRLANTFINGRLVSGQVNVYVKGDK